MHYRLLSNEQTVPAEVQIVAIAFAKTISP